MFRYVLLMPGVLGFMLREMGVGRVAYLERPKPPVATRQGYSYRGRFH